MDLSGANSDLMTKNNTGNKKNRNMDDHDIIF